MTKVFIDGSAGTTGLRIADRLKERRDLELVRIPDELRKDPAAKAGYMNESDVVFLCLPDAAAIEAASLVDNPDTAVIDTSTAHRTDDGWCYGFPELKGQRERIRLSKRIANPGCHASGYIALTAPLSDAGILPPDIRLNCFSLTGYSGGGKKMIAQYEEEPGPLLQGPRVYGIGQEHKHLPEMLKYSGLMYAPVFCPTVAPFYSGMETVIMLHTADIKGTAEDVKEVFRNYYTEGLVSFKEDPDPDGFLSAVSMEGKDTMEIGVFGNSDRLILVSRFDNLGKGASGAAIQNMNIILGADEALGLEK